MAILCPPATGHLNPMTGLARALRSRGHEVVFFQSIDGCKMIEAHGLTAVAYGQQDFPEGSGPQVFAQLGAMDGMQALRFTIELFRRRAVVGLRELPDIIRQNHFDVLVGDEVAYETATLAEMTDLPFVSVSNALVLKQDPTVPPCFTTWSHGKAAWNIWRNQAAYLLLNRLAKPIIDSINQARVAKGLRAAGMDWQTNAPTAHLSQQPREFDYPRPSLPSTFHYLGPFHDDARPEPGDFPWQRLDGRPMVYASMGTLQNRYQHVFRTIAEAAKDLPVQLVISLGGGSDPAGFADLPGQPLVVRYAPQLALLKRARLCVTHAGLNTALECLAQGVPMVALPVTNDQPGVAARIAWSGAGRFRSLKKLSVEGLRADLQAVLNEPVYREHAVRLQTAIAGAGRLTGAAQVIERIASGKS